MQISIAEIGDESVRNFKLKVPSDEVRMGPTCFKARISGILGLRACCDVDHSCCVFDAAKPVFAKELCWCLEPS